MSGFSSLIVNQPITAAAEMQWRSLVCRLLIFAEHLLELATSALIGPNPTDNFRVAEP